MKKIKNLFDIKLILAAIASAAVYSFAITNFSIPANLYPAGFSGISRITSDLLSDFANINISYSTLYLILNLVVVVLVFNKLGKKFLTYSTLQFLLVSFFTSFFKRVMIIDETILLAMFGGILNGTGIGIALSFNFSSAGFDFISIFFASKYKKDVWNYIFGINLIILTLAGFIYGWERALYSIIYQFASTQVIKIFHQRYTHKTLSIITKKPDEVAKAILANVRHGITEIKATGYYSGEDTTLLYTIINSFQYKEVVKIVMDTDPHAFINIQDTLSIYGNYYQKPLD